jgi:hypothetical protein
MNAIAEQYVRLVLALGQHDAAYVDAYYGPPEWKPASDTKQPLAGIDAAADKLIARLAAITPPAASELEKLRHRYLTRQLESMRARIAMLSGKHLTFDQESQALYDAVAPVHPDADFQTTLDELRTLLPGQGSLIERYDAFRNAFQIPSDRLGRVFDLAIAECRSRTLEHASLPPGESFTVEYVRNKSWSGYNWYQGHYRSLIQVNVDLPIYIDRAIDLAGHEGYPGHHVYNALLEKHLMRDRGWVEVSVYALFSPQSLIAEGTANYGIEVAFPEHERLAFERAVLFPAAGLDPSRVDEYYTVQKAVDKLSYAGNEAATAVSERRDRPFCGGSLAHGLRHDVAETRRTTDAFLRRISQLRRQLQPGKRSRQAVHRVTRRHRSGSVETVDRVRRVARLAAMPSGLREAGRLGHRL